MNLLHTQTNTKLLPSLNELQQGIEVSNVWFIEFVQNVKSEQLFEVRHFQFIDQKMGSLSVEEILFHMINHGTYHGWNIVHVLHHANVEYPADIYTVFIHQLESERRGGEVWNRFR